MQFIARVFLLALPIQNTDFSVLDLKAHYRGLKYLQETLKRLPQKPEPIVIDQLGNRLGELRVAVVADLFDEGCAGGLWCGGCGGDDFDVF